MRRRFEDNADTLRFLFELQRELDSKKLKLPAHCRTLLLYVSMEPGERAAYSDAKAKCRLTEGKMSRAVDGLVRKDLLKRIHQDADARRLHLELTKDGRNMIGALITTAQLR